MNSTFLFGFITNLESDYHGYLGLPRCRMHATPWTGQPSTVLLTGIIVAPLGWELLGISGWGYSLYLQGI